MNGSLHFFDRRWPHVRENVHVVATLAALLLAVPPCARAATLPPAEVARLEATCTAHVAFQTLTATLINESSGDPLALHDDNVQGVAAEIRPTDYASAMRIARERIAYDERIHGRGVDVGIAQINSHNFAEQHLTLAAAFDPCENLRVSARMLHALWKQTHDVDAMLQLYNSGSPTGAAGYVARVRAAARTPYALLVLGPSPERPQPAPRGSTSLDAPSRTTAHFYTEDAP